MLAGILVIAGTARAQLGGSINNLGSMNGTGSLNGASGINAGALTSVSLPSAPTTSSDFVVNQDSKNPGQYVPSTFASYSEAVALGKLQAQTKPLTLADAARIAQERKKDGGQKPALVVEENARGRLVIATAGKR